MSSWLLAVAAFFSGGAMAWMTAGARARARAAELAAGAAVAEAREAEVRRQLDAMAAESKTLHEELAAARESRAAAEARSEEVEKNLLEQRSLLDQAKTKLADTFRSLAAEALDRNNSGFLALAGQKFEALKEDATGKLGALVQPLSDSLAAYQKETQQIEEKRLRELGSLGNELRSLSEIQTALRGETAKLAGAMRSPQLRGRWGEMTLKRTAELAGMSVHCDFVEQHTATGADGRLRPDLIVKLPAGRQIVVDSKVPLDAYLDANDAASDSSREEALRRYSGQVSRHISNLSSKEYWEQFPDAPEFVVLFMPADSFLATAAEKDPNLLQTALSKKIVIATPSTFIALLLAVAYGWRQEKLAEGAAEISRRGQELYERMAVLAEHFNRVGGALGRAVESWNDAVGSWERRVLPSVGRFKDLGAAGKKDIEDLPSIDHVVRVIQPQEVQ